MHSVPHNSKENDVVPKKNMVAGSGAGNGRDGSGRVHNVGELGDRRQRHRHVDDRDA
jgi:hypothetical protein